MKFNSADGYIPNTAESLFGQGGDESFFSLLQYDEFLRDAFGESIVTSPASGWEGTQAIGNIIAGYGDMPGFVNQANNVGELASSIYEKLNFENLVGGIDTNFALIPTNFMQAYNIGGTRPKDIASVFGWDGSSEDWQRFAENGLQVIAQTISQNTQFANLRSNVSLGFQSVGWLASDMSVVVSAFQDLQNKQAVAGKEIYQLATALSQTRAVEMFSKLMKNSGLIDMAKEGVAKMLQEILPDLAQSSVNAIPFVGAMISAAVDTVKMGFSLAEAAAEMRYARDLAQREREAGKAIPVSRGDNYVDLTMLLDAVATADAQRKIQRGSINEIMMPPETEPGDFAYFQDLVPDGEASRVRVVTMSNSLFSLPSVIPGTASLTTGSYAFQTKRRPWNAGRGQQENVLTWGGPEGICERIDTDMLNVASRLPSTLSATSGLWQMVNSKRPSPMMFTVDAPSCSASWENFVQRQFELVHSFSSGWFCQSNIQNVEGDRGDGGPHPIPLDPDEQHYSCDRDLMEQKLGVYTTYGGINEADGLGVGVHNYPKSNCNTDRDIRPDRPLWGALVNKSPSDLYDLWKGSTNMGPLGYYYNDYLGNPKPVSRSWGGHRDVYGNHFPGVLDGVASGYAMKQIFVRFMQMYFGLRHKDPANFMWITKNLHGRTYKKYRPGLFIKTKNAKEYETYATFGFTMPDPGSALTHPGMIDAAGDPWPTHDYEGDPWKLKHEAIYKLSVGGKKRYREWEGYPTRYGKADADDFPEIDMWTYYPHPNSMDYSKSTPCLSLDNLAKRQRIAIVSGHPCIWGIDPDARVGNSSLRVFKAFDDPELISLWQERISGFMDSRQYHNVLTEDIANKQLRDLVRERKKADMMMLNPPPIPAPIPNTPVSPMPSLPTMLGDPLSEGDPVDTTDSTYAAIGKAVGTLAVTMKGDS